MVHITHGPMALLSSGRSYAQERHAMHPWCACYKAMPAMNRYWNTLGDRSGPASG